jgi:hypothetical protein
MAMLGFVVAPVAVVPPAVGAVVETPASRIVAQTCLWVVPPERVAVIT